MASTPLIAAAMADFADVAKAAGAGPDMLEYLEARSLHRTATLALVADTWDRQKGVPALRRRLPGEG